jgi:hypothetical protein
LGGYADEIEAAKAYDKAALAFWGDKARLNVSAYIFTFPHFYGRCAQPTRHSIVRNVSSYFFSSVPVCYLSAALHGTLGSYLRDAL